jgi:hypothetical protein
MKGIRLAKRQPEAATRSGNRNGNQKRQKAEFFAAGQKIQSSVVGLEWREKSLCPMTLSADHWPRPFDFFAAIISRPNIALYGFNNGQFLTYLQKSSR